MIHGSNSQMRTDLNVKIFKLLSESDVTGPRQPDTDRIRTWEVAGASHLDARVASGLGAVGLRVAGAIPTEGPDLLKPPTISGGGPGIGAFQTDAATPSCALPVLSRIPFYQVMDAAYDHLAAWVKDGKAPPAGIPFEMNGNTILRDEDGNARGGIRLAQHAVPTAMNTGQNTAPPIPAPAGDAAARGGPGGRGGRGGGGLNFCNLLGGYKPFDGALLARLYPTHQSYVSAVRRVTESNLRAGYIVKTDADATNAEASKSSIGKK